jgi:hypothetical protein
MMRILLIIISLPSRLNNRILGTITRGVRPAMSAASLAEALGTLASAGQLVLGPHLTAPEIRWTKVLAGQQMRA